MRFSRLASCTGETGDAAMSLPSSFSLAANRTHHPVGDQLGFATQCGKGCAEKVRHAARRGDAGRIVGRQAIFLLEAGLHGVRQLRHGLPDCLDIRLRDHQRQQIGSGK